MVMMPLDTTARTTSCSFGFFFVSVCFAALVLWVFHVSRQSFFLMEGCHCSESSARPDLRRSCSADVKPTRGSQFIPRDVRFTVAT